MGARDKKTVPVADACEMLTRHPGVLAAADRRDAAQFAALEAEKDFFLTVLAVASELKLTRHQAMAALGYQKRTGIRMLKVHGLTMRDAQQTKKWRIA